jgi:predicted AAA+ superfamily ATPase
MLEEAGENQWKRLWLRGGFPTSFLARDGERSHSWRINFIQSFLERDIPRLGIRVPASALRRFWTMLAHFHGQVWNAAELARAMNVKEDTSRHYLDILSGAFMIRQLPPWFENTGKRLVKAPKVYFRDTGLLHALLGLKRIDQVLSYPRFGFSWEGFAMEEIIRQAQADHDAYYYRTHAGAELDLLIMRGGRRYGFEFKFEDRPRPTRSMRIVLEDLKLAKLWIVYSGDHSYPLGERIEATPLKDCGKAIAELMV